MFRYLKSEFYRLLRNKATYLFIVICSGLLVSSNIVLAAVKAQEASFPYATTKFSISNFYSNYTAVFFLCIALVSIVFGNEHTNHTMKNSISYGISRGSIYFGKLIAETIYAVIAFSVIACIHIASAYFLLENSGPGSLKMFINITFVVFPLLLFALAASNCCIFLFDSAGSGIGTAVVLMLVLPQISSFLGMKFDFFRSISKFMPMNMINNIGYDFDKYRLILPWEGVTGYYIYWLTGIVELIIITFIGYMIFRKKEIK